MTARHEYSPDHTAVDRRGGVPACVICGMPKRNRVHHDVPADDSARITGDRPHAGTSNQLTH